MSDGFYLARLLSAFRDLIRLVPYQKGASDPWNDVGDEIGGDPVDKAGVDIGYLEQRRNLGVPGTTIDPNHICHAPGPIRVATITVIPDLTCRKTGSDLGAETPLPRSTIITFTLVQMY